MCLVIVFSQATTPFRIVLFLFISILFLDIGNITAVKFLKFFRNKAKNGDLSFHTKYFLYKYSTVLQIYRGKLIQILSRRYVSQRVWSFRKPRRQRKRNVCKQEVE